MQMLQALGRKLLTIVESSRFGAFYLLVVIFLVLSTVTRLMLVGLHFEEISNVWSSLPRAFLTGLFYDVLAALYVAAPLALLLLLLPGKWLSARWGRVFMYGIFITYFYVLSYLCLAELFFFDEFNSRLNYIAVDYLITPTEVFVNIWDTYPVWQALVGITFLTIVVFRFFKPYLYKSFTAPAAWALRGRFSLLFTAPILLGSQAMNINLSQISDNRALNEIAANGLYTFYYAAATNEMDYDALYAHIDDAVAMKRVKELIATPDAQFVSYEKEFSIVRDINHSAPAKPMNVVLILEESMGAKYVGSIHPEGPATTPELDKIASQGMLFTHIYATGNRTVRALEGTLASFPPIPGQSIVKRPGGQGTFTIASAFKQEGYQTAFIYGGRSYFDNMRDFTLNGGFDRVVDQGDFKKITFTTIWGVCDEDIFDNALHELDVMHASGKPFFTLILTVSNHPPFTFPAGPIQSDPSGRRRSALRYADYALGKFIREAHSHSFFDNTLFVMLGDHGARVYGKEQIPILSYEIPLVFYSPRLIAPGQRIDFLGSQMDIAPTILGFLHMDYRSKFFGRDMFHIPSDRRWALMNHNRDVALLRNDRIAILGVRQNKELWQVDTRSGDFKPLPLEADPQLIEDAIAYYQSAYRLYKRGDLQAAPRSGAKTEVVITAPDVAKSN